MLRATVPPPLTESLDWSTLHQHTDLLYSASLAATARSQLARSSGCTAAVVRTDLTESSKYFRWLRPLTACLSQVAQRACEPLVEACPLIATGSTVGYR
jgi:hypothetical protein